MRELALHVLDIAENSVKANASLVTVEIIAKENILTIRISDDGRGMSEEFLSKVTDPFTTTRTTRKVGMGIPLLKQAAETSGGAFDIKSKLGVGTTVTATFLLDDVDRMPLGDVAETATTLLYPQCDFKWIYVVEDREFVFDTREVKEELEGIPIDSPEIIAFLKSMLKENIESINGGLII
ncbi:MAG: sensor histidine kinase [Clostridia bacterium]|nr:sensor histidine kinase [Clostridia bacterium]MBO7178490.1 sensor histidine kinase [Clostridia bacterium]